MRPTTEPVRASAEWLSLREGADTAARSAELVEELRTMLPDHGPLEIHDLGCGTGSMARWLAGRLRGSQRWVLYDRDEKLLGLAAQDPPRTADGTAVTMETHVRDITLLGPAELLSATLVTASALLDMLTADELDRLVSACAAAGCPVLISLSVVGRVDLVPADPLDRDVQEAFNAHQRRTTSAGALLGPDAVRVAVDAFTRRGLDVMVRPSSWRLGPESSSLMAAWFHGWLSAACEHRPDLLEVADSYAAQRLGQIADGSLSVSVHHEDLLVRSRRPRTRAPELERSFVLTCPTFGLALAWDRRVFAAGDKLRASSFESRRHELLVQIIGPADSAANGEPRRGGSSHSAGHPT